VLKDASTRNRAQVVMKVLTTARGSIDVIQRALLGDDGDGSRALVKRASLLSERGGLKGSHLASLLKQNSIDRQDAVPDNSHPRSPSPSLGFKVGRTSHRGAGSARGQ
jgi:hypothetical protein